MRRLLASMLGLCLFAGAGCAHQRPLTPARQAALERRRISGAIAADHRRLLGEDAGPAGKRTMVLGVDVTGESVFQGSLDVMLKAPGRMFHFFGGETPSKYAREMETADAPDSRRAGILTLAGYPFARRPPYTTRYAQIATTPDVDYTVRAAAIRALNRSRDPHATPIFIRYLDDKAPLVRLEAAKALANIPDEKAVSALILHLNNEDNKDVRIACADALRNYRTSESARALVTVLHGREFSVAWQARQSLIVMTAHDFRYDDAQWLRYLAQSPKPFLG